MHLCLAEQRGRYLETFSNCLWAFLTVHPSALQPSALELVTYDASAKHTCLSLCVNMALCLGALHIGEPEAAEDLFCAAREDMVYLFDNNDYKVAPLVEDLLLRLIRRLLVEEEVFVGVNKA